MKFKAEYRFNKTQIGVKYYIAKDELDAVRKFYRALNHYKLPYDSILLSMKEVRNI